MTSKTEAPSFSRRDVLRAGLAAGLSLAGVSALLNSDSVFNEGLATSQVPAKESESGLNLWREVKNVDGDILVHRDGALKWTRPEQFDIHAFASDWNVSGGKIAAAFEITENQEITREVVEVGFVAKSLSVVAENYPEMRDYLNEKGLTEADLTEGAKLADWKRTVASRVYEINEAGPWYNDSICVGELTSELVREYQKTFPWLVEEGTIVMPDGARFTGLSKVVSREEIERRTAEWNEGDLSNFFFYGDELIEEADSHFGFDFASIQVLQDKPLLSEGQFKWANQVADRVLKTVLRDLSDSPEIISLKRYERFITDSGKLAFLIKVANVNEVTVSDEGELGVLVPPEASSRRMMENIAQGIAEVLTVPEASGRLTRIGRKTSNLFLHGETEPWLGLGQDSVFDPDNYVFGFKSGPVILEPISDESGLRELRKRLLEE